MGNVRAWVTESLDELRALDAEIAAWHVRWDASYAIGKHRTQLDLLAGLTRSLIDILIGGTSKIEMTGTPGRCTRKADDRLLYERKLWRYYADKFDQRAGLKMTRRHEPCARPMKEPVVSDLIRLYDQVDREVRRLKSVGQDERLLAKHGAKRKTRAWWQACQTGAQRATKESSRS
jgi:hypothetical protein